MAVMKNTEFAEKAKKAAAAKTAYLWGTFGAPVSDSLIRQKVKQYPARYSAARQQTLRKLNGTGTWAFDCVGLVKGILWGWDGDLSKTYGGGTYQANGVPDTTADGFEAYCTDFSTDLSSVLPGELLFMPGHIGICIGNGKAAEATLGTFGDGVVITEISTRGWVKHAKCGFIDYTEETRKEPNQIPEMILKVNKVGLRLRSAPVSGSILDTCPIGGKMTVTGLVPGKQSDGYQWLKTEYNGKTGYSQFDKACYTLSVCGVDLL